LGHERRLGQWCGFQAEIFVVALAFLWLGLLVRIAACGLAAIDVNMQMTRSIGGLLKADESKAPLGTANDVSMACRKLPMLAVLLSVWALSMSTFAVNA
jgi:hypothetical protein